MRYALALAGAVAACGPVDDAQSPDGRSMARRRVLEKIATVTGLSTPESVRHDPALNVWYVSNINGNPSVKDGNGFIAVVHGDTTTRFRILVQSGMDGAVLDAPKGMAITGDTLWVADIDALRGFDRRTGAPVATLDLATLGAVFLNDVTVGPDSAIYVTDSGIRFDSAGNMSDAGADRIYRVLGRQVSVIASGDSLDNPNGIAWDARNERWVLAPFGGSAIQTLRRGARVPATLMEGPGQYDGLEILNDGRILVSSWADNSVHAIASGRMRRVIPNVPSPADLGVDQARLIVAVPIFTGNRVEFWRIP